MKLGWILENINLSTKLIKKYGLLDLYLYQKEDKLYLEKIVVPTKKRNQGLGTKVMKDLINYADKNKLTIILTPATDFGGSSVKRLNKFYKRFGFVDNKGSNKDFTISALMYRRPNEEKNKIS